jgi:hypothetical protein
MQGNGQLLVNELTLDRDGRLDDPEYIRKAGLAPLTGSPNVAALAASVSAAQLAQFVSLVAAPAGIGVAGPLRYILAIHHLEHLDVTSGAYCTYENDLASGDHRITLIELRGQEPWGSIFTAGHGQAWKAATRYVDTHRERRSVALATHPRSEAE